jgi:hypothetical protein
MSDQIDYTRPDGSVGPHPISSHYLSPASSRKTLQNIDPIAHWVVSVFVGLTNISAQHVEQLER